jgi:addiction module HigA family antidote
MNISEDLYRMALDIDSTLLEPVTPGELLSEEFLKPMGISQYRLAKEIGVPAQRIGQIVAGKRSVTADTDLRLCRFLGLANGYWLRAQVAYDTEVACRKLSDEITHIRPWQSNVA